MNSEDLNFLSGEQIFILSDSEKKSTVPEEKLVAPEEKSAEPANVEIPQHYEFLVITENLGPELKTLLGKILSAVSIKLDQVQVVNEAPARKWTVDKLICFGPSAILQGEENFKVVKNFGGEVLFAPPLADISKSRDEKMKLWNALKDWFSIN